VTALQPGETIGGYVVTSALGNGGLLVPYTAQANTENRTVTLRVLRAELAADPGVRTRFLEEAQRTTRLRRPNLERVLGATEERGIPFLVAEHVAGETLAAKLGVLGRAGKRMPLADVTRAVSDIAAALDYAHEREFVHGGLSPSHVTLTAGGAAVVDGFAIVGALTSSRSSVPAIVFGAPEYMSPEQIGDAAADARSDIYALGIVAYEMLTGTVPFDRDSPLATALAHSDPLPLASSRDQRIGEATDRALLRALARKPSDRYPKAVELALALEQAIAADTKRPATALFIPSPAEREQLRAAGRALTQRPAPTWPARFARREVAAAAVAGALLALGGVAVAGLVRGPQATPVPPVAAAPVPVATASAIASIPPARLSVPTLGPGLLLIDPAQRGGMTPAEYVAARGIIATSPQDAFGRSPAERAALVSDLYARILGRPASTAERVGYFGMNATEIESSLRISPEAAAFARTGVPAR